MMYILIILVTKSISHKQTSIYIIPAEQSTESVYQHFLTKFHTNKAMLQKLCTICFLLCLTTIHKANSQASFVETNGTLFSVNGKTINFNGFNAYWMMIFAANPSTRPKVSSAFEQASKLGINLARVWGFSDGGDLPLQKSPGVYVEDMFRVIIILIIIFVF